MLLDKDKLLNTGYLTFNLKDIDESSYDNSKDFFKKDSLLKCIDSFRFDSGMINPRGYNDTEYKEFINSNLNGVSSHIEISNNFNNMLNMHLKLHGNYNDIKENIKFLKDLKRNTFQQWYYGEGNLFSNPQSNELLTTIYTKIPATLYNTDIEDRETFFNRLVHGTSISLYTKGDFIVNHDDGIDKNRLCVFLMYLNDDYQSGYGGEIKINDTIIEPIFGNIVILDFTKNNPMHEVLKVLNDDFHRYAIIKFFYK